MLQIKKIFISLVFGLIAITNLVCQEAFNTSLNSLIERYLEKASDAYDNGNIADAYKNINLCLKVSPENIDANVLMIARTVYTKRLEQIQRRYDEADYIDMKTNLDEFPSVVNASIKKLMQQIDAKLISDEKEIERKNQKEFYETIQKSTESTNEAVDKMLSQAEEINKRQEQRDIKQAERDIKNDKKFTTILIIVVVIIVVIMLVVGLILLIMHLSVKQSKVQQQQYAEAFKILAQNQSTTNRLMLGGITDLYGSDGLKSAGSSRWGVDALPEPEETPEEKEEMRELATKCEDLGAKIDQATGRKNNSKNVSELVYKIAMRLGLTQARAMVYFCASMVYDAGFLAVDEELLRAETITDEEYKEIQKHVSLADEYLQFVPKRYWDVFEDAAKYHHENMDGTGKPEGLKGDKIPEIARIIRVVDSFIALSSKRSFRGGIDKDSAIEKLETEPFIYDQDVIRVLKDII